MYTTGYKAFDVSKNGELSCMGFVYKVGETYEMEGSPLLCSRGFHFCKDLVLTLRYYDKSSAFAEVQALGEVVYEEPTQHKACTNKIKIIKLVSLKDIVDAALYNTGTFNSGNYNSGDYNSGNYNSGIYNSGIYNSGNCNSGDYNSGDFNSGDLNSGDYNSGDHNSGNHNSGNYNSGIYNSGDYNSGDFNSGDLNSGDYNSGNYNSGIYNSGIYNSGNYNSGDFNSGDFNSGSYNSGAFNTTTPNTVLVYDKPITLVKYQEYIALLHEHSVFVDIKDNRKLSEDQISIIKSIEQFDADVFFKITGIRI